MSNEYKNPPVIEAVCEFRLSPETEWDITIPGLIYEKVKEKFPIKEQRTFQNVELSEGSPGNIKVQRSERIVFLTEDKKRFIQISPYLLAINCLRPDIMWDEFKPNIEHALRALTDIVDVKGLQRIGIRYINRIEIPGTDIDLNEYFEFRPELGQKLTRNMKSFMVGCILPYFGERDFCKVQLTSAVSEGPTNSTYILDLDYYLAQPKAVSLKDALQWAETAHDEVEHIFEGCIKDPLRNVFGVVK